MGRQDFCCIGRGMTEQEALDNAIADARDEYGHQEGYSGAINCYTELHSKCLKKPRVAKRCNVEKQVQKGARKWETVFVIEPVWGFSGSNYSRTETRGTQGEAIKMAKEMALKNNKEYQISIEKRLVGSGSRIATVSPKNSEVGEWKFWGEARC